MIRHSSGKGSRATTGGGLPLRVLAGIDDHAAVLRNWRCRCRTGCRAPAASRRRRRRAAGRAACAARRRRRARSGCRNRDRHGAESPVRRPAGAGRECRDACRASPDARRRARFPAPRPMVSPERDSVTTVSGSLSGRPRLPKRRPASPLGSRKPRCRRAGTLMVTEFDICPPLGASSCIAKFRCPHS